ncbi:MULTISPECIES: hypothetical protein [Fischerella]|nr:MULTISPECIES: hypothetical protein [Fischerella]
MARLVQVGVVIRHLSLVRVLSMFTFRDIVMFILIDLFRDF